MTTLAVDPHDLRKPEVRCLVREAQILGLKISGAPGNLEALLAADSPAAPPELDPQAVAELFARMWERRASASVS